MTVAVEIRRLSVQDYHRMVETGILTPDERVELIEGQLYQMAAKGTFHRAAITRIKRLLERRLGNRVLLRFQDPVRLSDDSEPEPDVAVVQPDPFDYEDHHPTPEEIYLLIEVSDRTLKRDRKLKAPAYGRSGVREYWILDVNSRQLYVFREPRMEGYANQVVLAESDLIAPLAFPDCQVSVQDLLRRSSDLVDGDNYS
ncbi:MAG: Uma2 family endonuclease [Coleofasciculus sp. C1-SOL-03]|uniref:Uma2 family endonuclease n=1 Tax=Coleofasciculus sp. C1-SOL-03 TaxID=3069522 RepID=UPI0032FFD1E8